MKKRILSLILCLVLTLALVPAAFASYNSINLTIRTPVLGDAASFNASPTADTRCTVDSVHWFRDDDDYELKSGDVFEKKVYILEIFVSPLPGELFAPESEGLSATLNGEPIAIWSTNDGRFILKRYFDFTGGKTDPINGVDLLIAEPKFGEKATFTATPDDADARYTVDEVRWFCDEDNRNVREGEAFGAKTYILNITLSPLYGERFATDSEGIDASLNGEDIQIRGIDDGKVLLTKYFTVEVAPITPIEITMTAPKYGEAAPFTASAPAGSGYSVERIWWFNDDTGAELRSGDKFGDGTYILEVMVIHDDGLRFATEREGLSATVNGEPIGAYPTDTGKVFLKKYFTVEKGAITNVHLYMSKAAAGGNVPFTVTAYGDDRYTVESVFWICDDDDTQLKSGDKFGKKTYILEMTLAPKSGERFAAESQGLAATLNDDPIAIWTIGDGKVHLKKYFDLSRDNPFTDVKTADYFYDAVIWAYYNEPQITNGMGGGKFGGDSTVTRGQAVTFLWRAAGCPEPSSKQNPFTDVKETDYFFKPVLWAIENGITNGTGATAFSPDQTCSTAHIITFLYRTLNPGRDGWYQEAADWARENGLLKGLSYEVKPDENCARRDVVLFLYRKLA